MNEIIKYMESDTVMSRLLPVLGSEKIANSYVASALLAVNDSADLMKCSPDSIFQSVMRAAILRLSVDKALGEAWIIPRYNNKKKVTEATFQIGWGGYYSMAMKTREYRRIDLFKIDDGVLVEMDFDTGKPLQKFDRKSDGGWFAIFEMNNGYTKWLYWTKQDMDTHRTKYAPKNPIWKSSYDSMAKKTIGTHLFKKWGVFDEKDQMVLNSLGEFGEMVDSPELESGFHGGEIIDAGEIEDVEEEKVDPLVALGVSDPPKKNETRPYSAEKIRSIILDLSSKRGDVPDSKIRGQNQEGISYNKAGILAGIYDRVLGDKIARYETFEYIFGSGKRSVSKLSNAQILELLAHHSNDAGLAEAEIKAMYAQSQKDKGQKELI